MTFIKVISHQLMSTAVVHKYLNDKLNLLYYLRKIDCNDLDSCSTWCTIYQRKLAKSTTFTNGTRVFAVDIDLT